MVSFLIQCYRSRVRQLIGAGQLAGSREPVRVALMRQWKSHLEDPAHRCTAHACLAAATSTTVVTLLITRDLPANQQGSQSCCTGSWPERSQCIPLSRWRLGKRMTRAKHTSSLAKLKRAHQSQTMCTNNVRPWNYQFGQMSQMVGGLDADNGSSELHRGSRRDRRSQMPQLYLSTKGAHRDVNVVADQLSCPLVVGEFGS